MNHNHGKGSLSHQACEMAFGDYRPGNLKNFEKITKVNTSLGIILVIQFP